MPVCATNIVEVGQDEVLGHAIDCDGMLRVGETLSGTPTMSITPTGPDISSPAVGTGARAINGVTVATLRWLKMTIDGDGAAKGWYTISWSCATSASQTLNGTLKLHIL